MSRQPTTPTTDTNAQTAAQPLSIPAGRRFTGSEFILNTEAELVADGKELPNRAIPDKYHRRHMDGPDDIQQAIDDEVSKDEPNKQAIGYLNTLLDGADA
mgnify:CR=1 FL=1